MNKYNPDTWKEAFDAVINRLEQGQLPEHVDIFDMSGLITILPDYKCSACLFGSAALLVGWNADSFNRRRLYDYFRHWKPTSEEMQEIKWICLLMDEANADTIVKEYRARIG